MPPTVVEDRRREADRIRGELPPRPVTRRETDVLETDPDYQIHWVRGRDDPSLRSVATQFAVRFDWAHVIAFDYDATRGRWEVVATGYWPDDLPAVDRDLDRVASPTADWHVPLNTRQK